MLEGWCDWFDRVWYGNARANAHRAKHAVAGAVKAIDEERDAGNVDAMLAGRQRLRTPSDLLGLVASAVVLMLFVRQSLSTMHLEALASTLDRFVAYLPNVLVAAVVLVAGLWAGRFAGKQVDDLSAKSTDTLVRALGLGDWCQTAARPKSSVARDV